MGKFKTEIWLCDVCGHKWYTEDKPSRCAKCKVRTWDKNNPSLASSPSNVEAITVAPEVPEQLNPILNPIPWPKNTDGTYYAEEDIHESLLSRCVKGYVDPSKKIEPSKDVVKQQEPSPFEKSQAGNPKFEVTKNTMPAQLSYNQLRMKKEIIAKGGCMIESGYLDMQDALEHFGLV